MLLKCLPWVSKIGTSHNGRVTPWVLLINSVVETLCLWSISLIGPWHLFQSLFVFLCLLLVATLRDMWTLLECQISNKPDLDVLTSEFWSFYPFGKLVIQCRSRRDWMGLSETNFRNPEIVEALLRCFVLFCFQYKCNFLSWIWMQLNPALSRKGEKMSPLPQVGARDLQSASLPLPWVGGRHLFGSGPGSIG